MDLSPVHIAEELGAAVHAQGEALGSRKLVIAEIDSQRSQVGDARARWAATDWTRIGRTTSTMPCTSRSPARGRAITPTSPSPAPVAKVLARRYVNDGRYSPHRRRRHGRTAAEVPADRFVVAVQNHDQIGNRARGERLSTLLSAEALRLAAALVLLSPYVPLLFMGEEYGEMQSLPLFREPR